VLVKRLVCQAELYILVGLGLWDISSEGTWVAPLPLFVKWHVHFHFYLFADHFDAELSQQNRHRTLYVIQKSAEVADCVAPVNMAAFAPEVRIRVGSRKNKLKAKPKNRKTEIQRCENTNGIPLTS
jgi:hypothetical protein